MCMILWTEKKRLETLMRVVKVKWMGVHNGTREKPDVRCRRVALVPRYRERTEELFAGTRSLMVVGMLSHKVAMHRGLLGTMVLGVQCALLICHVRRHAYFELPQDDPEAKNNS